MEAYQLFREAGLPPFLDDRGGIYQRYGRYLGIVRAVYPELWRVDIEAEDGGLLQMAIVDDDQLPETHIDDERPSFVEYWHPSGRVSDVRCHVIPFRRLQGPDAADAAEKRRYDKHLMIRRVGDITLRITLDGKKIYLYDAESGDYAMYEQEARTFHVIGPHVFLGTDAKDRVELHTETSDDRLRVVIPKALLGKTAIQDADGISYTADQLLHLMSTNEVRATAGALVHLIAPAIKLTASGSITLDPPQIFLGNANATERVILGDLFLALYNAFVALFNSHVHTGVQTGGGTSGVPTTPASAMTNAQLSDIVHVSKSGG
jgi:hypothetical protein